MMEFVKLNKIIVSGNRCEYDFSYPEKFAKYVADKNAKLYFELPKGMDVNQIPEGILTIPFVGSVLSVTMLLGVGIEIPVLDEKFSKSIPNIKNVFKEMYPYASFCFEVKTDNTEDYSYQCSDKKSMFFTGGLDATSALVEKIDEKPLLINIHGGDILIDDTESKNALEVYFKSLSSQLENGYVFIESNCRQFFNDSLISNYLNQILDVKDNHGWWASIAHILAMATAIAPVVYLNKISENYIGSSYDIKSQGRDANNSQMANAIKYASCVFSLVDENLSRCEKAQKIVTFRKKKNVNFELKVCWYRKASRNCSHCEKCYRTILDILSCHDDPNDYGFVVNHKEYMNIRNYLQRNIVNDTFWKEIQMNFQKEYDFWKKNKDVGWILDMKINSKSAERRMRLRNMIKKFLKK